MSVLTPKQYADIKDKYRSRGVEITAIWSGNKVHNRYISSIDRYVIKTKLDRSCVGEMLASYLQDINYTHPYHLRQVNKTTYVATIDIPDIRAKLPRYFPAGDVTDIYTGAY